MGLGTLILLVVVVGEVVTLVKLSNQSNRIKTLEKQAGSEEEAD